VDGENGPVTRHDELAGLLHAARDNAVEYLASAGDRPVFPGRQALADLSVFDEPLPDDPTDPAVILDRLHRYGSPATVVTTGGRYFGFVSGGVLPAALAANWLAGAWDQNAGFWAMSPVASRLEDVAAGWLLDVLDLPRETAVGFVTGSTMGCFSGLAAARAAICARHGHDVVKYGLRSAPPIRVVASREIHPSNLRALGYLGLGRDAIEFVETDAQGRVKTDRLPPLDDRTIVLLQAGNVNTGSFDPFAEVCARAEGTGAWVHVDGAFGLWARASPSRRGLTTGLEGADSWNVDGHKWLNVPMDAGAFGCRHPQLVLDAFGVEAPYMVRSDQREPNYFTPETGRRARGVEFWAALRSLGRRGVASLIDRSCEYAGRFASGLDDLGFEILNEVCLNQVLFALPSESRTRAVLHAIQDAGRIWIGPTEWRGRVAMRISCCSWALDDENLDITMDAVRVAVDRTRP
jgi:glutamate/tyrosine decarboxylase-like PLP-dependent enzyme